MAIITRYICDRCKCEFDKDRGAVKGKFHSPKDDITYDSTPRNCISIIDAKGNRPELCLPCLSNLINGMLS